MPEPRRRFRDGQRVRVLPGHEEWSGRVGTVLSERRIGEKGWLYLVDLDAPVRRLTVQLWDWELREA